MCSQSFRKNFFSKLVSLTLLLFVAAGTFPAQQTQPSSSANSGLIRLRATVFDREGRLIPGLTRDDFTVFIEKSQQQISEFREADEPASIVLMVDVSGSMQTSHTKINRFTYLAQIMRRFIQLSQETNEYSIISFSREPHLALNWSRDPQKVIQTLTNLSTEKAKGATAIYNACEAGINQAATGTYPKRVLLLFSDGEDTSESGGLKSISLRDLTKLLLMKEVQVYAINVGTVIFSSNDGLFRGLPGIVAQRGIDYLDDLARLSGGKAYHPQNPAGMQFAAEMIATELRHQYLIAFALPAGSTTVKSLKVKVKLSSQGEKGKWLKGLSVRHQEEFFTTSITQANVKK